MQDNVNGFFSVFKIIFGLQYCEISAFDFAKLLFCEIALSQVVRKKICQKIRMIWESCEKVSGSAAAQVT